MLNNNLEAAELLVERGANLFMEDNYGIRAIDIHSHRGVDTILGPRVLQHALDLRWSSVKLLVLVANSISSSSSNATNLPQPPSSSLASTIFGNLDLVRHIASFMIRGELIVVDPSINQSDEVRTRVEATLAAAAASRE
jgi:hypothetical protein